MSGEISIHGKVQDYDHKPIFMIQVSAWVLQEDKYSHTEVNRAYTNEEGIYELLVLPGTQITVRFDTHWSLVNAKEWHPSVVANIDAKQDVVLNRSIMRVGTGGDDIATLDAFTAYQFCAMWTAREKDRESARTYAESAASRLSQMKIPLPEFSEFQQKLIEFFLKQAESF